MDYNRDTIDFRALYFKNHIYKKSQVYVIFYLFINLFKENFNLLYKKRKGITFFFFLVIYEIKN